jgi:hypothetical protein
MTIYLCLATTMVRIQYPNFSNVNPVEVGDIVVGSVLPPISHNAMLPSSMLAFQV